MTGLREPRWGRRLWRWWLLGLVLMPILVYLIAIGLAYRRPPVSIGLLSYSEVGPPTAMIQIENEGLVQVHILGVSVEGVPPPDEVTRVTTRGALPTISLLDMDGHRVETEPFQGWRLTPQGSTEFYAAHLVWYQTVDLRWLHCPTVRYLYLGWPFETRGVCNSRLRGAALNFNEIGAPSQWQEWRSAGLGVRFRTQRVEHQLWIQVAAEAGANPGKLIFNRFEEEPAGGRARFRLRVVTEGTETSAPFNLTVPLRWGEPDPEVELEVVTLEQFRLMR